MRSLGLTLLFVLASCRDTKPVATKPAPTITRLVPSEVTVNGYRLGTIEGEGFDTKAAVKVWFGATPAARAAVVAKQKIQVEIPPGTDGSEVEVRVEIAGYEPAIAPMKLRYISADRPDEGSADHPDESSADHPDESSADHPDESSADHPDEGSADTDTTPE